MNEDGSGTILALPAGDGILRVMPGVRMADGHCEELNENLLRRIFSEELKRAFQETQR